MDILLFYSVQGRKLEVHLQIKSKDQYCWLYKIQFCYGSQACCLTEVCNQLRDILSRRRNWKTSQTRETHSVYHTLLILSTLNKNKCCCQIRGEINVVMWAEGGLEKYFNCVLNQLSLYHQSDLCLTGSDWHCNDATLS